MNSGHYIIVFGIYFVMKRTTLYQIKIFQNSEIKRKSNNNNKKNPLRIRSNEFWKVYNSVWNTFCDETNDFVSKQNIPEFRNQTKIK